MATKRELTKAKKQLVYQIRNIKADYKDVYPEDIPAEITEELNGLMTHLKEVSQELLEKA